MHALLEMLRERKRQWAEWEFYLYISPRFECISECLHPPLSTDSAWDTFLPSTLHSFTSRPMVQGYVWSTMVARWLGPPRSSRFRNGTLFLTCSDFTYFLSKSPSLPLGPKGSCVRSSKGRTICTDEKSDAQAGHTLSSEPSILCVVGRGEVLQLEG